MPWSLEMVETLQPPGRLLFWQDCCEEIGALAVGWALVRVGSFFLKIPACMRFVKEFTISIMLPNCSLV